jgi:purine-binding chemotaxis protein CheW
VRGVLHLRRELVTIVDLRTMLGMPSYENTKTTKVLIVEHECEKYGLAIDSVNDLVTIDEGPAEGAVDRSGGAVR